MNKLSRKKRDYYLPQDLDLIYSDSIDFSTFDSSEKDEWKYQNQEWSYIDAYNAQMDEKFRQNRAFEEAAIREKRRKERLEKKKAAKHEEEEKI